MTEEQLRRRLEELSAVDLQDEDCDEAFDNRMNEISAINAELGARGKEERKC